MPANFGSVMTQMRDHYKKGTGQPFVIEHQVPGMAAMGISPQMAVTPAGFAKLRSSSGATLPPEFDEIRGMVKSELTAQCAAQKIALNGIVEHLKSDKDKNSYVANMSAQQAKAKADADASLDEAYDKAVDLGADQPSMQDLIVQAMNSISNTIQDIVDKVSDFIMGLVGKVMDVLNGTFDAGMKYIEDGFRPVTELVSSL